MNTRMKSKLKLKNRKKSEATPEFLNKEKNCFIDDCDSDVTSQDNNENENDDNHNDQTKSEQIRSNITDLANNYQEWIKEYVKHDKNDPKKKNNPVYRCRELRKREGMHKKCSEIIKCF